MAEEIFAPEITKPEATDELLGTWVFNESPELRGDSFKVNFISMSKSFGRIYSSSVGRPPSIYYNLYYGEDTLAYTSDPNALDYWTDESYRTITITDTSALTNRDVFTTWLKANAVKQVPKVTDLTGTTWKWNETPAVFPNLQSIVTTTFEINIGTDQLSFSDISFDAFPPEDEEPNGMAITYGGGVDPYTIFAYVTKLSSDFSEITTIGWQNEAYRTISITGGTDATNTELIDYLYANAELQSSQPEPVTYTVTYNTQYCFKASGDTSVTAGGSFTASIQAEQGFYFTKSDVIVTGATLTLFQVDDRTEDLYNLTFDGVTGDVTVTIIAKLTDLTGTTWKWNETLIFPTDSHIYNIDFSSDMDYSMLFIEDGIAYGGGGSPLPVYIVSWTDEAYRNISITGGTDATNTELIDYLYANAELQSSQPEPVTYTITYNLTNCYKTSGDTTVTAGGSFTASIQAEQGFYFTREQVQVTNATLSSFQADDRVEDLYNLVFDNATGNVTVSITAIVETIPAVSVAISTSEGTTITKGKYIVATAVLQPSDSTDSVTWTSSNPNVIAVENETDPKGKQVHLNGIKNGFSKITAVTDSGKTATLTFIVVTPSTAISIRTVSGASEVRQGNYITVDATLTPFDSTDRIVWRSSNNSILSLEQVAGDNKQIQVTGVSPGTAEIIATTESGVSDSIQISVYQLYNYDFKYYDGTLILALSNKRGIVRESLQYDETNNSVTLILFYNDGTSGTYTFDVLPKVGYNFRGFTTDRTGATPDIIIGTSSFVVNANTVFYPYYEKKQEPPVTEQLQLNVYQNKAEANRVDKAHYILYIKTLTGVFRDDSDLINLSVIVEDDLPNYNYVYIPQLKRYYFVQGISSVRFRLWELSLSCDVLMTYKDGIRKLTAFVDRNENSTNNDIIDPKRVIEQGYDIEDNAFTNTLFNTTHSFVLTGFALKTQKIENTN